MTDLSFASATELTALMRRRALSPRELMSHTLDRIATADATLNSVVALDPERALADATALTARIARGEDPGPLAGLPVLVKDGEDARGFPTSRGTSAYRDSLPAARDSTHVSRLRAAGALIIGKTNLPPLGAAVHTANDAFGITRNPWNADRTPGGSSGGAAAAVAAGLVALGTAGDGGGSTRIPAALCGVVGLKPSRGRIPQGPSGMPCWPQNICLSGMARTVRDTALHLDVAAGHHAGDPNSLPAPATSYRESAEGPLPVLRVGVMRTLGIAEPRPEMLHALERTAGLLRDLGHRVRDEESVLPGAADFPAPFRLRQRILAYNRLLGVLDDFTARRADFEPWFADTLDDGRTLTPTDFAAYWAHRARLDHWTARLFDHYDLLLMPTVPTTAWPAEGPDMATAVRGRTVPISYTAVFNDTGHPAISVPAGLGPDGLPCAVQAVAPHHRDDLALGVAQAIEKAFGTLRPPAFATGS
ncbi:amidase [Streptomyces sp. BE147]|uniref:amidase n=1 Tax=Streptomyces sp. BE147 TaxID=3002524 RepID=UPI002E79B436|nr:amidase [Streptomyces sp. BE147]MEE1738702.1 amidase [Streptomyces sp. BE147]